MITREEFDSLLLSALYGEMGRMGVRKMPDEVPRNMSKRTWPLIEKLQQEKAALRTLLRGEKAWMEKVDRMQQENAEWAAVHEGRVKQIRELARDAQKAEQENAALRARLAALEDEELPDQVALPRQLLDGNWYRFTGDQWEGRVKRPEGPMADVNLPASDELAQWKADRDMWMANATQLRDERDDLRAELLTSEDAYKAVNAERMELRALLNDAREMLVALCHGSGTAMALAQRIADKIGGSK